MKTIKQKTIGSVESFTGGLFASTIISKSGASKYFKGSIVSYSSEIKKKIGVNTSNGVINKNVAIEMALKGKEWLDVDYCVSFTGNAGPNVMEGKKVGIVYIAINENSYELDLSSFADRNKIREEAVKFAINELKKINIF